MCTTGSVHTLTCCTHICLLHSLSAHIRTSACVCTYTHGSSVCEKVFACVSHLSLSLSLVSCLTHLSQSPYDDSLSLSLDCPVRTLLPYLLVLKVHGMRHSARGREVWLSGQVRLNTGYETKGFDKITSVDSDTMLINEPNHNFSDFSKTTNENTGQFGVPTVFESSVSHVSHDGFALQRESKENMQSGTRCWTGRRRRKKRFCGQCCRIDVKERLTERYQ